VSAGYVVVEAVNEVVFAVSVVVDIAAAAVAVDTEYNSDIDAVRVVEQESVDVVYDGAVHSYHLNTA
jgi:hypothetical protein